MIKILSFILVLSIKSVISDQYLSSTFSIVDQCSDVCKKSEFAPLNKKEEIICERGCRFFNIIHFKDELNLNATKYECYNSCNESYSSARDFELCKNGCESMANKRPQTATILLVSEDESSNLIAAAVIESDIEIVESDPSQNRFDIGVSIDYKIPETEIRSMPIGFDDKSGTRKHRHSGDWLDCASNDIGIPRWILISATISIIVIALWVSFAIERRDYDEFSVDKQLIEQEKNLDLLENCKDYKYLLESDKV